MKLTKETIKILVIPYLENCASVGIRDPKISEYISKCAEGIAINILELLEEKEKPEDDLHTIKCGTCGKISTEKDLVKLKTPQLISEWDKANPRRVRDRVHICCNRVRMIDPNTGELFDYPIPENSI